MTTHIIETDDKENPFWRRNSAGSWENEIGLSWEELEPPDGLEDEFLAFMRFTVCDRVFNPSGSITYTPASE